ncbi:OmpA family protein [Hymenobacter lutimineralis]|uniref:OmpA family protein n=1 Tax=Hymenobacter lutimineralis TaxID=2606448 RepID=A0A5D6VDJ4_9BACT|nr:MULTISPECIES: OmpA family protein [Hymenobacter]QIX61198.1 OmpA family protein [Hymenobacter sp. BT18]TYZ13415.1 OmpA family protein [Hymenobacter lutimineralis]
MKTLLSFCTLWIVLQLVAAPAQAQLGLLWRVEDKLADKASQKVADRLSKKAEAAVERKTNEATTEYYSTLLADGKIVCHGIQFEPGTATITAASQPVVRALANTLAANPDVKVRIEAHTLREGNAATNLTLSQRRADAVRAALVRGGVDAARLTTKGYGGTKPLETDSSTGLDSLNQRTEFIKL